MFGSKAREIRDLQRALRICTQQRDDAHTDGRGALNAADLAAARLDRALRACARYRRQAALDRTVFNQLSARYWDALGYGPETLAKLDPSYRTEAPK
jgi:hypothetical protein